MAERLTEAQRRVLDFLSRQTSEVVAFKIALSLGFQDGASVGRIIRPMVQQGLVRRLPPHGGSGNFYSITAAGRHALADIETGSKA